MMPQDRPPVLRMTDSVADFLRLTGVGEEESGHKRGALLGLDLGEKRVGIAVSDSQWMVASPLDCRARRPLPVLMDVLHVVLSERRVQALVCGLPKNMDGTEGRQCRSVRDFALYLAQNLKMPVLLWDERRSSVSAERILIAEAGLSRKKRAGRTDKIAAALILQNALDALRPATLRPATLRPATSRS